MNSLARPETPNFETFREQRAQRSTSNCQLSRRGPSLLLVLLILFTSASPLYAQVGDIPFLQI